MTNIIKKWIKYISSIPAMGLEQPKLKRALMTFEQAETKLHKLAGTKFCTLHYERIYRNKKFNHQKCELYIDGLHTIYTGETWEDAFKTLSEAVDANSRKPSLSPAPKEVND
jgi:hypothetical protein